MAGMGRERACFLEEQGIMGDVPPHSENCRGILLGGPVQATELEAHRF